MFLNTSDLGRKALFLLKHIPEHFSVPFVENVSHNVSVLIHATIIVPVFSDNFL